jgi:hypothetical protein
MVTEAPPRPAEETDHFGPAALFPEARRLERHRKLLLGALALALAATAASAGLSATSPTASPPPVPTAQLLARPLHVPSLGAGGRCPVSVGAPGGTKYFGGDVFGRGPVRVAIDNRGDVAKGRIDLGTSTAPGWYALETIWYALPSYKGPFVVRATRIGSRGSIEVVPGANGHEPGAGPLVVSAGPTMNTYAGYRTQPGSTWVKGPGCYAWQVDGSSFSNVIVVDLVFGSSAAEG